MNFKPSIVLLNTFMAYPEVFIPQPDECFKQTAPSMLSKLLFLNNYLFYQIFS